MLQILSSIFVLLFIFVFLFCCSYLFIGVYSVYYCCGFCGWALNLYLDIMWEVPLGGRSLINSRHLGTFLLFLLFYGSFIYIVIFTCLSHLHLCSSPFPYPIYNYVHPHPLVPFTFMLIPIPLSHLHSVHPHPLYLLHYFISIVLCVCVCVCVCCYISCSLITQNIFYIFFLNGF